MCILFNVIIANGHTIKRLAASNIIVQKNIEKKLK